MSVFAYFLRRILNSSLEDFTISVFDTQPANPNYLSPLNFKFQIKKCPNLNFFVQRVNVPGFSLPAAEEPDPFVTIPYSGDHIHFSPLVVSFKVDEQLANYLEIFKWITGEGFDINYDQYADLAEQDKSNPVSAMGTKSDISVFILDGQKNPLTECVIHDAFPISLSDLQFDSRSEDVRFITAEAQFRYTFFTFRAFS